MKNRYFGMRLFEEYSDEELNAALIMANIFKDAASKVSIKSENEWNTIIKTIENALGTRN